MQSAAIYARVSTQDQDVQRQLDECREHIASKFPDIEDIDMYADIISGADEHGGEQYRNLCDTIEADEEELRAVIRDVVRDELD